ncbi:hypothetical protein [Streptomyces sp. Qhu_M48]|uniref:hypothetical protein n=1 Tax=Streptomyces sp. Qhu_M48 TaxID=3435889 RepID=UPI003F5062D0
MSSRSPDEFRLGAPPSGPGARAGDEPEDPHELLHRARRLTAHGHPWAGSAWERAATALRRAGGSLTPGDHADALDATALDCRGAALPAAGPLFFRAADLHEQAGQRGKALVSRARAVAVGPGPGATAFARLTELCERAVALHAIGRAGAAETATVRLLHARARADLLDTAPDPAAEAGALREELTRLLAFAAPHRADPAVLGVLSDTRALLGRITASDDPAAALAHLRAAIEDHRAGGRPWPATDHELLLAAVLRATGAHEEAAALLRTALASDVPETPLRAADRARLCLALAWTVAGPDGPGLTAGGQEEGADGDEGMSLLAEAVRHADGTAQDVRVGALARLRLGVAYAERGRCHEARELLEQAPAGLVDDGDTAARVRARAWLAECALRLGEPGRAAREYALAAAETLTWDDRRHGAALSHRTAHALGVAGSPEKAARAYERAADLWRAAGDHAAAARSLRARARQVRAVWGDATAEVVLAEAAREAGRGSHRASGPVERDRPGRTPEGTCRPPTGDRAPDGTVGADAVPGLDAACAEAEAGEDSGPEGARRGLRELPEAFGPRGRYQVNVYGDVGGDGPWATTAPGTRVQGCV